MSGSQTAAANEYEGFDTWLRETAAVPEHRRIARAGGDEILVSKFEPGFAARLHEALAMVPELFEEDVVRRQFEAGDAQGITVGERWRQAILAVLGDLADERGLTRDQAAEIEGGIDSVAALVESVLWSGAGGGPSAGEVEAYEDVLRRMDDTPGMFTRFYGEFDGCAVVNHCPGVPFARMLFEQAWAVCTRALAPALSHVVGEGGTALTPGLSHVVGKGNTATGDAGVIDGA